MPFIKNIGLQAKLIIVYAGITGVVLIAAFTIVSYINSNASRQSVVANLNVVADIIAQSSASSLVFSDNETANNYLQLLKSHSSIVYACIRDKENKQFAQFQRINDSSYSCGIYQHDKNIVLSNNYIDVYKPIMVGGVYIGNLQIKASLMELTERIVESAQLLLAVFIGLMLPTILISRRVMRMIVEPITNLKEIAQNITANKDYSLRMKKNSNDEVGVLIDSFNNMLDQIKSRDSELVEEKEKAEALAINAKKYSIETEQINKKLEIEIRERNEIELELNNLNETLEAKVSERTSELKELNKKIGDIARSAGMAEVASGVLHNVGNVLNSVNVSASVIREKVRKTKADNLSRVSTMLNEHKDDIANFIAKDESGKQIPKFIAMLAEQVKAEKIDMYNELDELADNIDHIKNVISMQQSYAGSYGVREKVILSDLVEDALRINTQGMGQHGVEIVRSYIDIPQLYIDKHKVLQIMINLISNAKHAIIENNRKEKVLNIKINKDTNNDMAVIEFSDTGIGIAEEDIKHLFEYGFKKRHGGHGFGLHHSSIVANELGGKILAKSDGLGKGASFILWLPYDNKTNIK